MESNNELQNIEQEARITRYLKGQMTADEEKAFVSELKQNPDLKAKAVTIAMMIKVMDSEGAKKDAEIVEAFKASTTNEIQDVANKVSAPKKQTKIFFIPRKTFIAFSAAASILVCLLGGYRIYDNHKMSALGGEYLAYFPASDYTRGGESPVDNELSALYDQVENGDRMHDAIKSLERLWSESRSDTYNDYTEYSPEIGWILANAYIRDNDKDKAIDVLTILESESEPGSAMAEKARELREKVEQKKLF